MLRVGHLFFKSHQSNQVQNIESNFFFATKGLDLQFSRNSNSNVQISINRLKNEYRLITLMTLITNKSDLNEITFNYVLFHSGTQIT